MKARMLISLSTLLPLFACGSPHSATLSSTDRIEESSFVNEDYFFREDRNSEIQFVYEWTRKHLRPDAVSIALKTNNAILEKITQMKVLGHALSATNIISIDRVVPVEISNQDITVLIDILESEKVYEITVQPLDAAGNALSSPSDVYYAPTSGDDLLAKVRAHTAALAIEEWGTYGKRGTVVVSGTRYGASSGEAWCSEYYSWVTAHYLDGIEGADWVGALKDYFKGHEALFAGTQIPQLGRAGDYLAMWGTEHSGMLLSFEQTPEGKRYMWTIEGNLGSKMKIVRREYKANDFMLGQLQDNEFRDEISRIVGDAI